MATFDLLAAIDLRGGRVVRLRGGDFERETAYSDDPAGTARNLVDQGIGWLHVVDLDGARSGRPVQHREVEAMLGAVDGRARVELGGGIRDVAVARAWLGRGLSRVVLGTMAVREPDRVASFVDALGPERVAVAIDVRGGRLQADAWTASADGVDVTTSLLRLAALGVTTFEVTAVDRDGSLTGPDLELLGLAVGASGAAIIASGGIRSLGDLQAVRVIGCRGAIVGRAIYDGWINLESTIAELADSRSP